MVTVKQLIEILSTMPPDFPVIYQRCSDWATLETDDVTVQRSTDELRYGTAIHHHNMPGAYRNYCGPHEYPNSELPKPADVVCFPGN